MHVDSLRRRRIPLGPSLVESEMLLLGLGQLSLQFDGKGERRTAMLISESAFGFGDAERKCEGAERLLCAFVDADPRG
jgi:hypothetical protein